ncbi:MAG TPA: hypothetical protein PK659_09655, partial [Methanothrix sp.]
MSGLYGHLTSVYGNLVVIDFYATGIDVYIHAGWRGGMNKVPIYDAVTACGSRYRFDVQRPNTVIVLRRQILYISH